MRKPFYALLGAAALAVSVCSACAEDIALAHMKDNAEADAMEIISMRSTLAKEFIRPGAEVNEETFKKVCGAVGKKVKEISEKEGVVIRHAAVKYRNPKNAATAEDLRLIEGFERDKTLKGADDETTIDGRKYFRVTRPIYVEAACLACHGEKDKRPAFIAERYPDDRAYGFKAGDLRGIISVYIPLDVKQK